MELTFLLVSAGVWEMRHHLQRGPGLELGLGIGRVSGWHRQSAGLGTGHHVNKMPSGLTGHLGALQRSVLGSLRSTKSRLRAEEDGGPQEAQLSPHTVLWGTHPWSRRHQGRTRGLCQDLRGTLWGTPWGPITRCCLLWPNEPAPPPPPSEPAPRTPRSQLAGPASRLPAGPLPAHVPRATRRDDGSALSGRAQPREVL